MKPILVVNDLPGIGKVAGLINHVVLSAAGLEVALLPTVLLANHTSNGPVYRYDLNTPFTACLSEWQTQPFEAVVTGYFANTAQLNTLLSWWQQREIPLIVDPIMGDNGTLYTGFDNDYVQHMRRLVSHATLILPNYTEACLLTGETYQASPMQSDLERVIIALKALGAKQVVITGVELSGRIGCYLGEGQYYATDYVPQYYTGTGDLLTSCVAAGVIRGMAIGAVTQWSVDIIARSIELTRQRFGQARQELYYEPLLGEVAHYFNQTE